VLTGNRQTSKEPAYVEATRASQRTDWFIARDDLGENGQDAQRITHVAQKMTNSRAQTPSLAYPERLNAGWGPSRNPLRLRSTLSPTRWLTSIARPNSGAAIPRRRKGDLAQTAPMRQAAVAP
jgi:hypothetical protein